MNEPPYDVFLSYNSRDRQDVQAVYETLATKNTHLKFFKDEQGLTPGDQWQKKIRALLETCRAILVFLGPHGYGPIHGLEIDIAVDRQRREPDVLLVPVRLPGNREIRSDLRTYHSVDLRDGTQSLRGIEVLLERLSLLDKTVEERGRRLSLPDRPYLGLTPFREEDEPFLFGRDDLIAKLKETVDQHGIAALVGVSGSGKSSIAYAGLIPRLRRDTSRSWQVAVLKPSDRPLYNLAAALFPLLEPNATSAERFEGAASLAESFKKGRKLRDLLDQALENKGSSTRIMLLADQWEELYSPQTDGTDSRLFVDNLVAAVQAGVLRLVITLRIDFYSKLEEHPELSDLLSNRVLNVGRMSRKCLRAVIEEPGRKIGLEFSPLLVDRMIEEVVEQPVQLPLLEFALTGLWDHWRQLDDLDAAFIEMGGIKGAIAKKAEAALKDSGLGKASARRLLLSLVRVSRNAPDVRRRALLHEVSGEERALLLRLVAARILVMDFDPGTEQPTVELAHDALLQQWAALRTWLEEERPFLLWRDRALDELAEWQNHERDPGYLLKSAPLAEAQEQLQQRSSELPPELQEYIRLGIARRNAGRTFAATLALLVIAILAFEVRYYREQSLIRLSRALAAESVEAQSRPEDLRLLLSLQSFRLADTVDARSSLMTLLDQHQHLKLFLHGDGGAIYQIATNKKNRTVAFAGNGPILLWNEDTGEQLDPPFVGHEGQVLSLAFSPDGETLASSGGDKTLRFWDVRTRKQLRRVPLDRPARAMVFNRDGSLLALSRTEKGKGVVFLWDMKSGWFFGAPLRGHDSWISSLDFAPTEDLLASGGSDGKIVLWNARSGKEVRRLAGPPNVLVMAVAFRPDGKLLASGGSDRKARLWNVSTGEQLGEPCAVHRDFVLDVAFSPNGQVLASTGRDRNILLWDVKEPGWTASSCLPIETLTGHGQTVWSLAFLRSGRLISAGDEGSAILWELKSAPLFAEAFAEQKVSVNALAYNRDGEILASGGRDGSILLRNARSGAVLHWLRRGSAVEVYTLAFGRMAGRDLLVSGDAEGRVLLWDVREQRLEGDLAERETSGRPGSQIWAVACSSDNRFIAAGDQDGRIRVWSTRDRHLIRDLKHSHRGAVLTLAFSPDGRMLASGGRDKMIYLRDMARPGILPVKLDKHKEAINVLAFSPDGKLLASGSSDLTVRLWNLTKKSPPASYLTGPEDSITGLAFRRDGNLLAATSEDGRVFLWDPHTERPMGAGLRTFSKLYNVAFDPGGLFLVVSGEQGTLQWDLRYETWRKAACRVVRRNFSRGEWQRYLAPLPYEPTCPELASVVEGRQASTDGLTSQLTRR